MDTGKNCVSEAGQDISACSGLSLHEAPWALGGSVRRRKGARGRILVPDLVSRIFKRFPVLLPVGSGSLAAAVGTGIAHILAIYLLRIGQTLCLLAVHMHHTYTIATLGAGVLPRPKQIAEIAQYLGHRLSRLGFRKPVLHLPPAVRLCSFAATVGTPHDVNMYAGVGWRNGKGEVWGVLARSIN
eukprot:1394736-Amorphochlora_amoeboformis.AAC.1